MANQNIFHEKHTLLPATGLRARQLGEMHYFTGKPCSKGHICPRYASSSNCVDCIAERMGRHSINIKGSSRRSGESEKAAMDAMAKGFLVYSSEAKCPKGHSERFVSSNNCVECNKEQMLKRSKKAKWSRIKKIYGLEERECIEMMDAQSGKCAICSVDLNNKNAHIDHCHESGKVRGFLCGRCNQGIGLLDESEDLLLSAINYIRSNK